MPEENNTATPPVPSKECLLDEGFHALNQRRFMEAQERVDLLLEAFPESGRAIYLQGLILAAQEQWLQAEVRIIQAAEKLPENADIYSNLAVCRLAQEKTAEAIDTLEKGLRLDPRHVDCLVYLGTALMNQGKLGEAARYLKRAVEIAPGHINALQSMSDVLEALARRALSMGEFASAELFLDELVKLRPHDARSLLLSGNVYLATGKVDEAADCYQRSRQLDPHNPDVFANLGTVAAMRQDLDAALAAFNEGIALDADHAVSRFNRGLIHLAGGRYREGWLDYDYRKMPDGTPAQGAWLDFSPDAIRGKRVLVRYEQGFGDNLQFCRFLPLLKEAGAEVHFLCMPALRTIMESSFDLDGVFSDSELEAQGEWDFEIPLLSLPRFFDIDLATLPNRVPYLHPPAERLKAFLDLSVGKNLRIGLSWRALNTQHNDFRRRACTLDDLDPLLRLPGIDWYSLEKGESEKQLAERNLPICDLAPRLGDFSDTAAAASHLDLVISTDTVVAHVPGGLGKPVWTLVPFSADWRWLQNRDDSPWYPTMRLFRQARPGDWQGQIAKMKELLLALLETRASRMP